MTPEEDPFIEGIAAEPADEALRLVYSDWLEEHGEDARAAYLRAEVAHFRKPEAERRDYAWSEMPGVDPVWAAMVSRTGILVPGITFSDTGPKITRADLKALEDHWGQPLPPDYVAFMLLYNGGKPDPGFLYSYEKDYDEEGERIYINYNDELRLFSLGEKDENGRPYHWTTATELSGGATLYEHDIEDFNRMMPIGLLTYETEEGVEADLYVLVMNPTQDSERYFHLEFTSDGSLFRGDEVNSRETFTGLLHSLETRTDENEE